MLSWNERGNIFFTLEQDNEICSQLLVQSLQLWVFLRYSVYGLASVTNHEQSWKFQLNWEGLQYRGSYTSGHFIWNLLNEPLASFINFIWNDHSCKFPFIIWPYIHEWPFHIKFMKQAFDHSCKFLFIKWPFEMGFHRLQSEHYVKRKTHCWHGCCQWCYMFAPKCYYTCGLSIFYDTTLSTEQQWRHMINLNRGLSYLVYSCSCMYSLLYFGCMTGYCQRNRGQRHTDPLFHSIHLKDIKRHSFSLSFLL